MLTKEQVIDAVDNCDFYTLEEAKGVNIVDTIWTDSSSKYTVLKIETSDAGILHVKFYGYYSSWDGTDWQEAFLVEPKETTIVEYVTADIYTLKKQQVLDAIKKCDYHFFLNDADTESVHEQSWGDGNSREEVFKVQLGDDVMFVKFEG